MSDPPLLLTLIPRHHLKKKLLSAAAIGTGVDLRRWLQRKGVHVASDVPRETLDALRTAFDLQDMDGPPLSPSTWELGSGF